MLVNSQVDGPNDKLAKPVHHGSGHTRVGE